MITSIKGQWKIAAKATVAVQQFYLAIVKGPGISCMRSDETWLWELDIHIKYGAQNHNLYESNDSIYMTFS